MSGPGKERTNIQFSSLGKQHAIMKILSVNLNGLRLRSDKVLTCVQENNIDVLCLQEVHSLNDQERHDFEKRARNIGYKWRYRNNCETKSSKMSIQHIKMDNLFSNNRLTHIKVTSKEVYHILSIYASRNVTHRSKEKILL